MGKTLLVQADTLFSAIVSNATRYALAISGAIRLQTNEAYAQKTFRSAGTLSNLYLRLSTNSTTGDTTFTSRINGADGNLLVTVPGETTGEFEDATGTDTISAGDEVCLKLHTGTGGSGLVMALSSCVFEASSNAVSLFGTIGQVGYSTASSTTYGPWVGTYAFKSDETVSQINVPVAGILKNACAYLSANTRTTDSTLKNRVNGADGNISITIPASTTGFFEDTTNTDSLSAGDLIAWSLTTGSGTGSNTFQVVSAEFETTDGKGFIPGGKNAGIVIHAGDNCYMGLSGQYHNAPPSDGVEADVSTEVQFDGTFSNLWCYISANTVSAESSFALRKNQGSTALVVSIPASTTGEFSNTSDIVSFSATDEASLLFSAPASGTSLTVRNWSVAFPAGEGATQKTVTDTGTGADDVTATNMGTVVSPTDIGTGSDGVSVGASVPVAETGTGDDSIAITVLVGVTDSGSGADVPSIVEPAMLGLLERFDGTLDDWTLDTSGGTAQIQAVDNDEKLVLNDTDGGALVSATRAIEGQSAPFCIEADIYAASGAIGILEALDSDGNVLFSIKMDAGAGLGTFGTDDDTPSTFALTAAKYYQVVFYCDTIAHTVRAWQITGTGTAPSTWSAIGGAKSYTGGLVSKVRLTTDSTATGEARFDEVKVFRPNLFCIGDSNTAGYKSSTPYWNPVPSATQRISIGEDEAHAYPYHLGLKFDPVQMAANRGINADKSADVDGRIQGDVIDQGAQTVAILIGTNDITAGTALATIEANIQSAAGKADTAGLTVCLCSVPPRNAWDATQNTKRDDLNAWIESHCTTNGYKFADVYTAVKDPSDPDQLNPAYDAGDGLHFLTAGLQVIADTVYGALLETKSITDTGIGADAVEVRNLVSLADTGAGTDGLGILAAVNISESAAGADGLGLFAVVSIQEGGAGLDGLGILALIQVEELASAVEGLLAAEADSSHSIFSSNPLAKGLIEAVFTAVPLIEIKIEAQEEI